MRDKLVIKKEAQFLSNLIIKLLDRTDPLN